MFINKYNNDDIRRECIINDNIKAPLKEGDEVGVIKYYTANGTTLIKVSF